MEHFPNQQSIKEKYLSKVDENGFLSLSDAREEFGRQIKSIAALLDGDEGTEPHYNYGAGLKYKGSSGNYPNMRIHIDDLETFIKRVKKHYGEE